MWIQQWILFLEISKSTEPPHQQEFMIKVFRERVEGHVLKYLRVVSRLHVCFFRETFFGIETEMWIQLWILVF